MFFRVSLGQSECMSMSAFLRKRCTAALKNIEHLTRVAFTKKKHLENENLRDLENMSAETGLSPDNQLNQHGGTPLR